MTAEKTAIQIIKKLRENGFEAYFAGGCVRDMLLERTPKDFDIATNALPEVVETIFQKTIAIGKSFGVIAVISENETFEVATFREDCGYQDGRRPESIKFCAPKEDAKRRDFTVNGMFYDPIEKKIIDFVDGQTDLKNKIIRAIGDPEKRFQEDHLRMLRAIRFTHTLGFKLDENTKESIKKLAPNIKKISAERVEQEISRTLTESKKPGDALRDLVECELIENIIPEIMPLIGLEQPPQYHPEGDVFEHTVLMLNLMNFENVENSRELAYSVLLHDLGKATTKTIGPGADGNLRIRFDGHASESAKMAELILKRLKLPNKEQKHIIKAVKDHMRFIDVPNMKNATKRKMLAEETFPLELELHRVDCLGSHADLKNYDLLLEYKKELANKPALPTPLINGRDLIELGIKPGPEFKAIIDRSFQKQLEDESIDKKEMIDWILSEYKIQSQQEL